MMLLKEDGTQILLVEGGYYFVEGVPGVPLLKKIMEHCCIFEDIQYKEGLEKEVTTYAVKFKDIYGECPF